MPIIAAFLGMIIRIFHADHPPPHVHVQYGEHEAIVEILTGDIIKGSLPGRIKKITKEWLKLRKFEVLKSWQDAQSNKIPRKIKPLE